MAEKEVDLIKVRVFVKAFLDGKVFDGMIINLRDSSYEKPIRVSIWETGHVYNMRKQDQITEPSVNKRVSQPLNLSMETENPNKVSSQFDLSPHGI